VQKRAKSGAQRTVVGGAGLVLAALVAKWLGNGDVKTAIGLYCLLTLLHLVTNHRALKLVALDWLNGWRLHLVVEEFLKCVQDGGEGGKIIGGVAMRGSIVVSNPVEVSRMEPLLFLPEWRSTGRQTTKYPIRMGISFNEFSRCSHMSRSSLQSHLARMKNQQEDNYILSVGRREERMRSGKMKLSILVSYFSTSTNSEKAKVYLHCSLIRRALASLRTDKHDDDVAGEVNMMMIQIAEEVARSELEALWPIFEGCVTAAGWKLDKTECSTEGYEMHFE
jgi:hypothetical protein